MTDLEREFSSDGASDIPISLATPATWQQTAEIRQFEPGNSVASEISAGNAGNKPAEPFDVARLETPELIGWLELRYGGKVSLGGDGPIWSRRREVPPAEVVAVMKERRLAVQVVLLARAHAAKTRTREPDSWGAADWLAYFHERAGIRKHDGHTARPLAELEAHADCAAHWLHRNSPAPGGLENGCWQCGHAGTDADGADPMVAGICRGGMFYLHPRCEADYEAAGKAQALAALEPILGAAS